MDEYEEISFGSLTVIVKTEEDRDFDSSYMGEFADRPDFSGAVYNRLTGELVVDRIWYDDQGDALDPQPDEDEIAERIYAANHSRNMQWIQGFQHYGTAKDFVAEHCAAFRAKGEDPAKHSRQYCIRDARRLEALNDGDWYPLGILASVELNGAEIGSASVWGTENDSDESYIQSVRTDIIDEALRDAQRNIADHVQTTLEGPQRLQEALQSLTKPPEPS